MGTSKRSSGRVQVNLSLSPSEAAKLDAQRAQLGDLTRARAIKLLWSHLGDDARDLLQKQQATAGAGAKAVLPLVDAMKALDDSVARAANQRRAIGVHSNQIAKLANLKGLTVRDGGHVSNDAVEDIAAATEGVVCQLAEIARRDAEDDQLRAELRALIQQYRNAS